MVLDKVHNAFFRFLQSTDNSIPAQIPERMNPMTDSPVIGMRYGVRESVLHTRLETESVLLDLDSGRYFSLNSVGSRIWDRLAEQPRTAEELIADITEEYEVSRESAEQDILDLLRELVTHNLLEPRDR